MARYIDIDKYDNYYYECNVPESGCKHTSCFECFYDNGGAENVVPAIHAKWIPTGVQLLVKNSDFPSKGMSPIDTYQCSNCNRASIGGNYCSHCGAKMDEN